MSLALTKHANSFLIYSSTTRELAIANGLSPPVPKLVVIAAVGTDGDAPHHRRFVIRTVGDGAVGHHRRFVI